VDLSLQLLLTIVCVYKLDYFSANKSSCSLITHLIEKY